MTNSIIEIQLNGKPATISSGKTISALLADLGFQNRMIVVEVNGTIVNRGDFPAVTFQPNDKVEVVHFVGGGCR